MLANDGIVLLDRHLVGHVALVLVSGIEVAGAGAGYQSDLVSHRRLPVICSSENSDFLAARTQVAEHLVDADLVDDAHAFAAQAQFHETLLGFHPETMRVQVRQEATLRVVVGVRYVVADLGRLAGHHTYSGHGIASNSNFSSCWPKKRARFIPEGQASGKFNLV